MMFDILLLLLILWAGICAFGALLIGIPAVVASAVLAPAAKALNRVPRAECRVTPTAAEAARAVIAQQPCRIDITTRGFTSRHMTLTLLPVPAELAPDHPGPVWQIFCEQTGRGKIVQLPWSASDLARELALTPPMSAAAEKALKGLMAYLISEIWGT
jgi:hypothetical protein